jgi:hypothetical protein
MSKMSGDEIRKRIKSLLHERIDEMKKEFPRAGALSAGAVSGGRKRKSSCKCGGAVSGGAVSGGAISGGKMNLRDRQAFMMIKHHPKYGGAWYDWFKDTASKVANEITNPNSILRKDVIPVAKQVYDVAKVVAPIVGLGRKRKGGAVSGGKKGDGRAERAMIVKKVMKEKGMKMIEASKYVKQHGLY